MELERWFEVTTDASGNVIAAVLEHLPQGGVFVDVGAGVGAVSAAAIAEREATVYAFEPVVEQAVFAQSRCPTARVYQHALGSTWEVRELWCDRDSNPGWNTFVEAKLTEPMEAVRTKVLTLDSFGFSPDVVKIDVEGWEHEVLAGAHATLLRSHPTLVIELGWGVNHPERERVDAELEWCFANGYKRTETAFEMTKDVVLCPSR